MTPRATATVLLIVTIAVMLGMCVPLAFAQEHEHGQNNLPDWYDPACCNQRDCKPVKDEDVEFDTDGAGNAIIRYLPTGNTFFSNQWRRSQDERYHACINSGNGYSLCFYIRAGV